MGWDVVEIGLKHKLPVRNPYACAEEVSKRLNRNIWLVARNEFINDKNSIHVCNVDGLELIDLGRYKVNDSDNFLKMTVSSSLTEQIIKQDRNLKLSNVECNITDLDNVFELYEIEDVEGDLDIRIFEENVDLDVYVPERWTNWKNSFHDYSSESRNKLLDYKLQILERAEAFGCERVIICADQGPTQLIFDRMNWKADDLLKYTKERNYVRDYSDSDKEEWIDYGKLVEFSELFEHKLKFKKDEFVDIVFL